MPVVWKDGLAGGRLVYGHVITNFRGWVVSHIFLPMVLRSTCFMRESSANGYKMICLDSPPLWTSEIKTSYTPSKIQCNLLGPDNQVGHSSPVLDISCNYKKKLKTILQ